MRKLLYLWVSTMLIVSCIGQSQNEMKLIEKKNIKLNSKLMTPEVLWHFGRLGSVLVSPDGRSIAYTVTWYDIEENIGNSEIYIMDVDGNNKRQLTRTPDGEGALQWRPDGKYLGFIRSGKMFEIKPDGSGEREVNFTSISEPISEFTYSPQGDKVLLVIETKVEKVLAKDIYPDLPKANAYTSDDLMYRHWDTWRDGTYNHLYIAQYSDGKGGIPEDIMKDEPFDAPMKPFDDVSETAWSPDGNTLAYSSKKLSGKNYAESTDSQIYLYSLKTKETKVLTEGMSGYDKHPVFSPDGTKLLWLSMERAGYEADKERIFIYDFATGEKTDYSSDFDASPSSIEWSKDGNTLYFTACIMQTYRIFSMNLADKQIQQLSKDIDCDYQGVQRVENGFVTTRTQIVKPGEIYFVDNTGSDTELSFINKDILDQLELPSVEKRMVKTSDNKEMLTWVVLPPNFDKNKQYPVIMMCTGGPQGPISQTYSYRWNYALMASNDYVVIYPARRGVGGMGQEWSDAVSKDHGGQPERDLLSAIDDIAKEPWVNKDRLGAVGASYGGYSIFWLAGNHNKRFKAFIAHCGIFDMHSMYTTTEEMFFENWETGGPFWDKTNLAAQKSFAQSPMNFVNNWDTPIMIVHGEKDFRVPYSQGMAAFNVARMKNIPARLLIFPEENHWVLRPQNAIVWQREFFSWMNKYLKN